MKNTERFSTRVEDYVKARPDYPPDILRSLQRHDALTPDSAIADIGSGTGLLTRLFLDNGNPVFGIEPNAAMREAGEKALAGYKNFTSVAGTAEATTLDNQTCDFVVAGQAFHWFDQTACRKEFTRILKPGGKTVIIWNLPKPDDARMQEYNALFAKFGGDTEMLRKRQACLETVAAFFPAGHRLEIFDKKQPLNREGFLSRVFSSSFSLQPHEARYAEMRRGAEDFFDAYAADGQLVLHYETRMYVGALNS